MATYFAFNLDPANQLAVDDLLAKIDANSSEPLYGKYSAIAIAGADEILDKCVEELMRRLQSGEESGSILQALLGLLKGTAHMLIKQFVGKHSNEEVARMAQYQRIRRITMPNGELRFGFKLPDSIAQGFKEAFAAVKEGRGLEARQDFLPTMLAFGDEALARFYDDFISPMELGFIKRKASDLGRGTIHKGIHVAINKLVPNLDEAHLKIFAEYYESLIVDA